MRTPSCAHTYYLTALYCSYACSHACNGAARFTSDRPRLLQLASFFNEDLAAWPQRFWRALELHCNLNQLCERGGGVRLVSQLQHHVQSALDIGDLLPELLCDLTATHLASDLSSILELLPDELRPYAVYGFARVAQHVPVHASDTSMLEHLARTRQIPYVRSMAVQLHAQDAAVMAAETQRTLDLLAAFESPRPSISKLDIRVHSADELAALAELPAAVGRLSAALQDGAHLRIVAAHREALAAAVARLGAHVSLHEVACERPEPGSFTYAHCSVAQRTSGASALTNMHLDAPLRDAQAFEALRAELHVASALTALHLQIQLPDGAAPLQKLAPCFSSMPQLRKLGLDINMHAAEDYDALATALPHLPHLQNFLVEPSCLEPAGFAAIILQLRHCRELRNLVLSGNKGDLDSARALLRTLRRLQHLNTLCLCGCQLSAKGVIAFVPALKSNTNLTHLDLSKNWPRDEPADDVYAALCALCHQDQAWSVQHLTLGHFVSAAVRKTNLGPSFRHVRVLNLSGCQLVPINVSAAAAAAHCSDTVGSILAIEPLEDLHLADTGLNDECVAAFAPRLHGAVSLARLGLPGNGLGNASLRLLAVKWAAKTRDRSLMGMLHGNKISLTCAGQHVDVLDISAHGFDSMNTAKFVGSGRPWRNSGRDVKRIAALLHEWPGMEQLVVTKDVLDRLTMPILVGAFSPKHHLHTLELRECCITDFNEALLHVLPHITSSRWLRDLNLSHNNIGPVGIRALVDALDARKGVPLQRLNVQHNPLQKDGAGGTSQIHQARRCHTARPLGA